MLIVSILCQTFLVIVCLKLSRMFARHETVGIGNAVVERQHLRDDIQVLRLATVQTRVLDERLEELVGLLLLVLVGQIETEVGGAKLLAKNAVATLRFGGNEVELGLLLVELLE